MASPGLRPPARTLRARRLFLVEMLGLPLGALLVLAAAVWAFGAIAEEYVTGDPIVRVDNRLATALHERAAEPLTTSMRLVTKLGGGGALALVCVVAFVALARRGARAKATFVVLAFLGAEVLTVALKAGFRRERPFFVDPLATEDTFSFPSGHALNSLVVYGALAFVLGSYVSAWRARVAFVTAAGALVLVIGFSRLYLGVHYLSDVLAGYSAGLAWLLVCVAALRVYLKRSGAAVAGRA